MRLRNQFDASGGSPGFTYCGGAELPSLAYAIALLVKFCRKIVGEWFDTIPADSLRGLLDELDLLTAATLSARLMSHQKRSGKVCPFENITKQLLKLATDAGVPWKHNGLRHSAVSYHIAERGNAPLVAEESGNSVFKSSGQIICAV